MKRLSGRFTSKNLIIRHTGGDFSPSPEFCRERDLRWPKLVKHWQKQGGQLWDAPVYRLNKISSSDDRITAHLGSISFRDHFVSAHLFDLVKNMPFACRPHGIYVAAYLKTRDLRLVFGRRSLKSVLQTEINFLGGSLNPNEQKIESASDLFAYFLKEFEEETGLKKEVVKNLTGLGFWETANFRVAMILAGDLIFKAGEVVSKSRLNFENRELVFLTSRELLARIGDRRINPVIGGSLPAYLADFPTA
ncbi:MAG: NUDIX hydrolase [Candidatus Shapirobacteria bacterium]